jgi:hypothetical protein
VKIAAGVLALCIGFSVLMHAQEANSGVDLQATVTGEGVYSDQLRAGPRNGSAIEGGVRSIFYPTIKFGEHWTVAGAIEVISRPWDPQDFAWAGYGIRGRVIQATAGYSAVGRKSSLVIRAGQMPSAFGSFMLRYDDAENPMLTAPAAYGYYYNPVATLGIAAIQADVTAGKWDGRVQFANSSPANPRSIFDKDQYGNWAGGAGYTVRQGLRIGASGYRGPYLDRDYPFYFRGEAKPKDLAATGLGLDADWAIGHWNVRGEWQRFVMTYRAIPDFHDSGGYAEVKRVIDPRWFVAARVGYLHSNVLSGNETFEGAVGFRANRNQLVKAGYLVSRAQRDGSLKGTLLVQFVTTVHPLSLAWR